MEVKTVKRKISELKPDPEQPRKEFEAESITNLALTMGTQGIINPIEIDENNGIITGEMRWRAAKEAKLEEIECKEIKGLSPIERFERQTIENIHHNLLNGIELENAIKKLMDSGNYKTQEALGKRIGYNNRTISDILQSYDTRKTIESKKIPSKGISTATMKNIARLPKSEQSIIANKINKEEIRPSDIANVVSEMNKLPIDIKKELLKPNVKITQEKLEEAREVATMPKDVQKEVLDPKSEITIKEAKEIADIIKPEIRKEAIQHIKKEKELHKDTIKHITNIAKGITSPPTKIINIDQKVINQFIDIKKQIIIKMSIKNVESYNKPTQNELIRIMKECLEYLQKELNIKGDIINV